MERTAKKNFVLLKLIFINWCHNKLFLIISLFSLVVTSERILTVTFATLFCLLERLYLPETSYDI